MWIKDAKQLPITDVAKAIGAKAMPGRSIGPCVVCGVAKRGSKERRGPIGYNAPQTGWMCHPCGAKGDVVDFVAFHHAGVPFKELNRADQSTVRMWFAKRGACSPPTGADMEADDKVKPIVARVDLEAIKKGHIRPPQGDLLKVWQTTSSFEDALAQATQWSDPLAKWLMHRQFAPLLIDKSRAARVMPPPGRVAMPKWWPKPWLENYRVVVPTFEADGTFASMHARSIALPEESPKSRWPLKFEASRLVMANPAAVRMMRGKKGQCEAGLIICEGLTDYLRACCSAHIERIPVAIISATSGGFKVVPEIEIPQTTKVFIATDADERGQEYAAIIADRLTKHKVYRIPLEA